MDYPLGTNLAIFCHVEEHEMLDCPIDYKAIFCKKYIDKKFVLFSSELHVTKFSKLDEFRK